MPKKIAPPHEFTRSYALSFTIETLDAGQIGHKQALMQARQLETTTPYNLEIQNFMTNRLWEYLKGAPKETYENTIKATQIRSAQPSDGAADALGRFKDWGSGVFALVRCADQRGADQGRNPSATRYDQGATSAHRVHQRPAQS